MSPEQQQQVIDRLKREYADAKQQHNLLRIELESIGRNFVTLGQQLIDSPSTMFGAVELSDKPNPMFEKIDQFVNELREKEAALRRLKSDLASVGVHVD